MFRRAYRYIARYKVTVMSIALVGLIAAAAAGMVRIKMDLDARSAASVRTLLTASDQPDAAFHPLMLSAHDAGSQPDFMTKAPGSALLPYSYAVCPPEMRWFPRDETVSGYTPVEQPAYPRLGGIKQISVGHVFDGAGYGSEYGASYALTEDGTVFRWGITEWSRASKPNAFPLEVSGLPDTVIQLDGRFALLKNGEIYDLNSLQQLEGLPKAFSIAQSDDSSVYVIGLDGSLQLYSMLGPESTPSVRQLAEFDHVRAIKASPFITVAIDNEGKLWMAPGAFDRLMPNTPLPLALPEGAKAQQIETTMSSHLPAFVLSDHGDWFLINSEGTLEPVTLPASVTQLTATQKSVFALQADGTVWEWGESSSEVKTNGQRIAPDQVRQIAGLSDIQAIAAGADHLLALTREGQVLTMGSNMYGQLGRLPIYAADPQPFGSWPGVDALFAFEDRLLAIRDGDLWALSYNGEAQPVVLGEHITKAFDAFGHFAALTADGRLLVADPEETKPCRLLQADEPIADASSVTGGVLIALIDGRTLLLEGNLRELDQAKELSFNPKPAGKPSQVFGNPVPIVLTDAGELYYNHRTEAGAILMEKVELPAAVKQWSPLHYVYFDDIGYAGKVLDVNHQVYDVELKLHRRSDDIGPTSSIIATPTDRYAVSLTGGAEIGEDGTIYEQGHLMPLDTRLPSGIRLRSAASLYHYYIEGRVYFYHFFAAEDGALYWLGDRPHTGPQKDPGFVSLP